MLSSHPGITVPQETHFFARLDPRVVVGVGELSTDKLIQKYTDRVTSHPRWCDFGISKDKLIKAIRSGATDGASLFPWLLREIASGGPIVRIGEKTPRHCEHLPRILQIFPDAKIIHIHRDPRDVILSLKERAWAQKKSVAANARHCRGVFERMETFQRNNGEARALEVSYESLVAGPERELKRVCAFLGEPFDASMLRYHERDDPGFSPRESDWKALTQKPIDLSRIGRYRSGLSPNEIRIIEYVVGDHLTRLGYEPEPGVRPMSVGLQVRMHTENAVAACKAFLQSAFARIARLIDRK